MTDQLDRLSKALEGVDVEAMLQPSERDAPLVDRLRNPPSVYSPVALRNEAADEIERLRAALRPFAAAVFNDNGDVTISTGHIGSRDYRAARKALKHMEGQSDG